METINGSDLLVSIGTKAIGHCTTHTATFSTDTKDVACKPKASENKQAALFKSKTVSGLSVQVKADGLACYGEDEAGFPELLKAWHEGKPVDLSLFSRGNTETPYYKGPFVISSLEQTAPAGEDTTFSATFDNAGAPATFDEKKFDATTAGGA